MSDIDSDWFDKDLDEFIVQVPASSESCISLPSDGNDLHKIKECDNVIGFPSHIFSDSGLYKFPSFLKIILFIKVFIFRIWRILQ